MIPVALFGAGGKMGSRICDNLKDSEYRLLPVEVSPTGIENLRRRGLAPVSPAAALREADVVVLAVPDNRIGEIAADAVPRMRAGAMLVCLDAAAPHAGRLPARPDVSYFVTHPCHPSVFNHERDPEAARDYFGGIKARQNIVCALLQGPEADYARGEALCRRMFAPVVRAHRVTVEQLALLEPALAETVAATCIVVVREAMEEAIRRGVPREAARDFLLGHLNIELAIVFEEIPVPFSDGARKAIEEAKARLFRPDWKQLFEPEAVRASVERITRPPAPGPEAAGGSP